MRLIMLCVHGIDLDPESAVTLRGCTVLTLLVVALPRVGLLWEISSVNHSPILVS